jgi:hypothetical protein
LGAGAFLAGAFTGTAVFFTGTGAFLAGGVVFLAGITVFLAGTAVFFTGTAVFFPGAAVFFTGAAVFLAGPAVLLAGAFFVTTEALETVFVETTLEPFAGADFLAAAEDDFEAGLAGFFATDFEAGFATTLVLPFVGIAFFATAFDAGFAPLAGLLPLVRADLVGCFFVAIKITAFLIR